jgi:hypothetical protein
MDVANQKLVASVRVYLEPEMFMRLRKAARDRDVSLSGFIADIVRREIDKRPAAADRNTLVLDYASIQLDLILAHLNPELKKKAREVFKARNFETGLPLVEAGNAL